MLSPFTVLIVPCQFPSGISFNLSAVVLRMKFRPDPTSSRPSMIPNWLPLRLKVISEQDDKNILVEFESDWCGDLVVASLVLWTSILWDSTFSSSLSSSLTVVRPLPLVVCVLEVLGLALPLGLGVDLE